MTGAAGRPGGWPERLAVRPAAVVFDCDGLLVDTEPSWEQVEVEMFARRGLAYGADDRVAFLGISVGDTACRMAQVFDEPGQEAALHDEMLVLVRELMQRHAGAMPGALDLVAALRAKDVPLAVASNSPRSVVEFALALGGLDTELDVLVTADDVALPKPAPDLYAGACARLGVDPSRSVAFEDSATGAASARAAGLAVVGVPTHPGDLPVDWQLSSLADPAVADWIASW